MPRYAVEPRFEIGERVTIRSCFSPAVGRVVRNIQGIIVGFCTTYASGILYSCKIADTGETIIRGGHSLEAVE